MLHILVLIITIRYSLSLYPVLLVPGDLSSHLEASYTKAPPSPICGEQNKWFFLWLNPKYFLPIPKLRDCFFQTMSLNYNLTSRTSFSLDFCEVRVPGFGTVDTIMYLTKYKLTLAAYFAHIVEKLTSKFGYVANKNIIGAPYDFRLGPRELEDYLQNVKALIEKMSCDSGNKPVVIIGHSMGCLHIVRLMNKVSQQWKDKYVKTFISISSPYSGTIKALYGIITGFNSPLPYDKPQVFQPMVITWPSIYYLLPSPKMWSTPPIVTTTNGNFTAQNLKKLLKVSKVKNAIEHYEDVVESITKIRAPNVTMHCLYSRNVPTPERLVYSAVDFLLTNPEIIHGDGDGSVNMESLKQCMAWKNEQVHPVDERVIDNVNHFNILRDQRALSIITDTIADLNEEGH